MEMINLSLSAPPLTSQAVQNSRLYLFLLPSRTDTSKESVVGAIILTRIESAMKVVKIDAKHGGSDLVHVDSGLFCHPERIPAAMGVSRLFVSTMYRRKGIASLLLSAAARTFVHGCPLRFEDGSIAFSQPTESGRKFMVSMGNGSIGIYDE